ncbi:hypothetical protein [Halovivax limisalsi]|uniref:hypothetical protein n=1 Tax=Halovivax limisalsi TaxID=1453760 RepID=UPI001FFC454A|nr:hypothetical protein [Halovivax limisalsi]
MTAGDIVVYVAHADDTAAEGAEALQAAASGVEVVPATEPAAVSAHVPEAACVVFAETPTTVEGASLLDVVEAAAGTPLILFSDSTFEPGMARSTDGITDYVRRDTEAAAAHLADAVVWTCRGGRDESASAGGSAGSTTPDDESAEAEPGADDATSADATERDESADDEAVGADSLDWRSLAEMLVRSEDVGAVDAAVLEAIRTATAAEHAWIAAGGAGRWTIAARRDGPDDDRTPSDDLLAAITAGTDPVPLDEPPSAESVPDPGTLASTLDRDRDGAAPVPDAGSGSVVAVSIGPASALLVWFEAVEDPPDAAVSTVRALAGHLADARSRRRRIRWFERAAAELGADVAAASRTETGLADEVETLEARVDALETDRDRFRAWFRAQPEPALAFTTEDGRAVCRAASTGFETTFELANDRVHGEPLCDVLAILDAGTDGLAIREDLLAPIVGGDAGDPPIVWRCETVDGVREVELAVARVDVTPGSDGGPVADGVSPGGEADRRPAAADGDAGDVTADADADRPTSTGVVQFRDVTERRRTERELAATRERLESVGDLLEADARPALNVARGYLELAEETGERTEFAEVEDAHESIGETLDHLARVVGRDADIIEAESIALFDLARQAWVAVDPADARLDLEGNVRFTGDRDRLRAVFEHVIAVATAGGATDDGSDSTAVTGDAADEETVVSVGATDDGFYIAGNTVDEPPDALTEPPAAADGTGIRLGLVERVARAHGWRVGVAEGESGTAFAFRGVAVEGAE